MKWKDKNEERMLNEKFSETEEEKDIIGAMMNSHKKCDEFIYD